MANNRNTERAHWLREQAACSCFPSGTTMLIDDTYADLVKKITTKHGVEYTDNGYNSMDHEQPRLVIEDGDYEVGLWVYGGEDDCNEGELLGVSVFHKGYLTGSCKVNLNELSPNVLALIKDLAARFELDGYETMDGEGGNYYNFTQE